jgi:hypothetical protein
MYITGMPSLNTIRLRPRGRPWRRAHENGQHRALFSFAGLHRTLRCTSQSDVGPGRRRHAGTCGRWGGRPLALVAGIWAQWTSVRKVREAETTNNLFAFLTTEPNAIVKPIHAKAMPVILTRAEEIETWLTAPGNDALKLQRPLPGDALSIVARGEKQDGPSGASR